jgi:DNA-binding NtrC family response regulator
LTCVISPEDEYSYHGGDTTNIQEIAVALRILVVDDNESYRDLLVMHLSMEGYDVLSTSDGNEAIGLLESQIIDLALLDINIPNVSGMDILRHIQTHGIEVRPVMISGSNDWQTWKECVNLGAVDFVPKPCELNTLMEAIEGAMAEPA